MNKDFIKEKLKSSLRKKVNPIIHMKSGSLVEVREMREGIGQELNIIIVLVITDAGAGLSEFMFDCEEVASVEIPGATEPIVDFQDFADMLKNNSKNSENQAGDFFIKIARLTVALLGRGINAAEADVACSAVKAVTMIMEREK